MESGSIAQLPVSDLEIIQNIQRFVLHHDFIEKHSAAPGAAAGSKFALKNGNFQSGFSQIAGSNKRRRTAADTATGETE